MNGEGDVYDESSAVAFSYILYCNQMSWRLGRESGWGTGSAGRTKSAGFSENAMTRLVSEAFNESSTQGSRDASAGPVAAAARCMARPKSGAQPDQSTAVAQQNTSRRQEFDRL